MVISQYSTAYLQMTSGLSGVCSGSTTTTLYVSTPSGYTTTITLGSSTLNLVLSSDSKTITATNTANSACSGSVTKTSGAIKHHMNIIVLFALLALVMGVSKM
jgi:hypothetical protein